MAKKRSRRASMKRSRKRLNKSNRNNGAFPADILHASQMDRDSLVQLWRAASDTMRWRANSLRKNSTGAELSLYEAWRKRPGATVACQIPIDRYIADFYLPGARLIVEVDGSSHRGREDRDQYRTERLARLGYWVIRFSNAAALAYPHEVIDCVFAVYSDIGGILRSDGQWQFGSQAKEITAETMKRMLELEEKARRSQPAAQQKAKTTRYFKNLAADFLAALNERLEPM